MKTFKVMEQSMRSMWLLTAALVLGLILPHFAEATEISSCKYLQIVDFTSDPYGIANELRKQGAERGFVIVLGPSEVPLDERTKACVMAGNWSSNATGGRVNMRVVDGIKQEPIAEASAGGTAWWSASRTVHSVVGKVYSQLGYSGFNEQAYFQRLKRQYPERPKIAISEAEIKKSEPHNHIEGVWSESQNNYRLGIIPSPANTNADFVAVILESHSGLWQPGEIKAEFHATASPDLFTCTWYAANKTASGTTFSIDHDAVLRGTIQTEKGPLEMVLLRAWPTTESNARPAEPSSATSGTGFLIDTGGLIATNWHVIDTAKNLTVSFPGDITALKADVPVRDTVNDLAIIRIADSSRLPNGCRELPFQLASARNVSLGEHVTTVGYPLSTVLGSAPKFSEGSIASKSGLQDDPRWFQISAPTQPGSSGSPLFDKDGNIVGVVVATLDAAKAYQLTSAIPQNVNWAIKSDYLLNLAGMIPDAKLASRTGLFSAEKAAACIALIKAW
jgi:S1-C subfamily serine protease